MTIATTISRISISFLILLNLSITDTSALSIEGSSSSYQITGDTQAPVSAPVIPKTVIQTPVTTQVSPTTTSPVQSPIQKKILPKKKIPVSVKAVSAEPVHASAPSGKAASEAIDSGIEISIAVLQNIPIISTIRSTIHQIAEGEVMLTHASASEVNPQIITFVQYLSFALLLLFAFGLGCIAAPLKRNC
ncbi:MAG: hypothetical protein ACK4NC_01950 [Candidatus Gracilibacteria bacterium]